MTTRYDVYETRAPDSLTLSYIINDVLFRLFIIFVLIEIVCFDITEIRLDYAITCLQPFMTTDSVVCSLFRYLYLSDCL